MGAPVQTQIDDLRFESKNVPIDLSIEEDSVIIFLIFQNMWPEDTIQI